MKIQAHKGDREVTITITDESISLQPASAMPELKDGILAISNEVNVERASKELLGMGMSRSGEEFTPAQPTVKANRVADYLETFGWSVTVA